MAMQTPFSHTVTAFPVFRFPVAGRRVGAVALCGRSTGRLLLGLIAWGVACQAGLAEEMPATVSKFVQKHCVLCHAGDDAEAGLDLTALSTDLSSLEDEATFARWVQLHDRVQRGEMPPPKETEAPAENERTLMLAQLGQALMRYQSQQQRALGRVPLRRLNRSEYENTLRDLFDMPGLQVKEMLPEDSLLDGFDKASRALDISAVQLRKYLEAANFVLDEAIAHEARPMEFHKRFRRIGGLSAFGSATFPINNRQIDPELIDKIHPRTGPAIHLLEKIPHLENSDSVGVLTHARPSFIPEVETFSPFHSGFYRIRTSVWSFELNEGKMAPASRMQSLALTADGRVLAYFDAPSMQPQEHEIVVWLNASEILQLNPANLCGNFARYFNYVGPAVAIDYVDITGPLLEQWPPASHRRLFGNLPLAELPFERDGKYPRQPAPLVRKSGSRPNHVDGAEFQKYQSVWTAAAPRPEADAARLLADFLPRAFRRPVPPEEIEVYVRIAQDHIRAGEFFEDAMRAAYCTALCSPDFLFLVEPAGLVSPKDPNLLDSYAYATRISYFLWNSMPDEEMTTMVEQHRLGGANLVEKVDRMLLDPRSDRFINDFLDQWLHLREIDFTSPDRRLYPEFRNDLRDAMLAETRAYFREMLEKDLGPTHLIDSDFVMINQRLAEFYGIPGVEGSAIRRVELPPDCPRGGLLTQASVLKVTANGTSTSPVKRGAWVLDRILGQRPQPPPPNIPAVEPDLRGTTTIREQLDKHRADATCARCHAKIDPPGFALESFDVIGRWRTQYRYAGDREIKEPSEQSGDPPLREEFLAVQPGQWHHVQNNVRLGLPVDASGETSAGEPFENIEDLKRLLARDEEALARNLVERLVLYGTGAPVTFADRAEVQRILDRSRDSGFGLRTLLHEILISGFFRRK
ncbi:DUF1592 domain-containing protein [Lignipirellula cremea]|uniref:Planctomycete cytochrome C n=1 Tax=Lignipirellula cremea TaxID=2528010 RepID=A0A518DM42_9BACT|nr:DUF1592 domain-containing protein [Lignipirellula cremea]QDU92895.1 hypothetical protein Pla8534_06680 [Lignipirellula cremea]